MRFTVHDNGHLLTIRTGDAILYVDHRGRCRSASWPPGSGDRIVHLMREAMRVLPEIREAYVAMSGKRVFGCPRTPERLALMKYLAAALNRRLVDVAVLDKGAA